MSVPYQARYSEGVKVRIRDKVELTNFKRTWRLHDPLSEDQLAFAGEQAVVEEVGYYHGGDPLYKLRDIPGVWHEQCLEDANNQESYGK